MIRVFNKPLIQSAAAVSPVFNAVIPEFSATAAAEITNSIIWRHGRW